MYCRNSHSDTVVININSVIIICCGYSRINSDIGVSTWNYCGIIFYIVCVIIDFDFILNTNTI